MRASQSGFTLIELMIVVGIVGILAAISVSQFNQYVIRVRQKEAQLLLTGIYTAEAAAHAEFGSYTGCISQAGFVPLGSKRYYSVGFSVSIATTALNCRDTNGNPVACNSMTTLGGIGTCNTVNAAFGSATTTSDLAYAATIKAGFMSNGSLNTANIPGGPLQSDSFLVGAIGNIRNDNYYDCWMMDHRKTLRNACY